MYDTELIRINKQTMHRFQVCRTSAKDYMYCGDPQKPTLYGCYHKNGRTEERNFICNELSNAREDAVGVTHVEIHGRFPQNNFFRNDSGSYTCLVHEGSGVLSYFFENVVEHYPIAKGDYINIPRGAIYAFEGGSLMIILIGMPQWQWGMLGIIPLVTIE